MVRLFKTLFFVCFLFAAGGCSLAASIYQLNQASEPDGPTPSPSPTPPVVATDYFAQNLFVGDKGAFGNYSYFSAVTVLSTGKILAIGTASNGENDDFLISKFNADGSPDTTFGGGKGFTTIPVLLSDDSPADLRVLSSGKIIVGGSCWAGFRWEMCLTKLNADGTLDSSFGTAGKVQFGVAGNINYGKALAIQADGKILMAGEYRNTAVSARMALFARFNTDGSLDTTFDSDGYRFFTVGAGTNEVVSITEATDNTIYSLVAIGSTAVAVLKLTSAGATDTTFDTDGRVDLPASTTAASRLLLQSNGKIVVAGLSSGGAFVVTRLNAVGTLDTTFDSDGVALVDIGAGQDRAYDIKVDGSGNYIVAGKTRVGALDQGAIVKLTTAGALDTTFGTSGIFVHDFSGGGSSFVFGVELDSSSNIIAVGRGVLGSNTSAVTARLTPAGVLDSTFCGATGFCYQSLSYSADYIHDIEMNDDGDIFVAGYLNRTYSDNLEFALIKYLNNGEIDPDFGDEGYAVTAIGAGEDRANALKIQSDGKIVLAGWSYNGANDDFAIVRYNVDGSLDTTFDTDGIKTINIGGNDRIKDVALQADGKIVVVGVSGTLVAAVRLLTDGTLDTTFDTDGIFTVDIGSAESIEHIAIQSDNKILVVGDISNGANNDVLLFRIAEPGGLDATFGTAGVVQYGVGAGNDTGQDLVVQSNGRIVIGGGYFDGANTKPFLARYLADGTLDPSFGTGGLATDTFGTQVSGLALNSLEEIVVSGLEDNGPGYNHYLRTYDSTGVAKAGFGTAGVTSTAISKYVFDDAPVTIFDDKIYTVHTLQAGFHTEGTYDVILSRYSADGILGD